LSPKPQNPILSKFVKNIEVKQLFYKYNKMMSSFH